MPAPKYAAVKVVTLPFAGGLAVGGGVGVGNGGSEPIGFVASSGTSARATSRPRVVARPAVASERASTSGRTARSAAAPARTATRSVGEAARAAARGDLTAPRSDWSRVRRLVARRQLARLRSVPSSEVTVAETARTAVVVATGSNAAARTRGRNAARPLASRSRYGARPVTAPTHGSAVGRAVPTAAGDWPAGVGEAGTAGGRHAETATITNRRPARRVRMGIADLAASRGWCRARG